MRVLRVSPRKCAYITVLLLSVMMIASGGCSRAKHRVAADKQAYDVIAERNCDPRWHSDDFGIDADPRSRFFDPYDPDHSPIPLDDPASHQYMKVVAGRKGWKHWYDNGQRCDLENPAWPVELANYVDANPEGAVKLDLDTALRIAYIHSPANQTQLETLYLSALDVTAERFRLDTQFFGGYDARHVHNGSLIPPGVSYSPVLRRFVINPAIQGDGVENNRTTLGRPLAGDPALQLRRRFATAGEILVGFANSFVFEFTGDDANLAASIANFSLVQPLLRGAGRDIALEELTDTERDLLANLRAYHQYRQGFYTQIAIGELGVAGTQRAGFGTALTSFSGGSFLGGYIGLLQQLQQIRNSEDNLSLQLRTLAQLEALLEVGVIDLVQVDQFRQSIENERSRLLQSRNSLELSLDQYKTNTLGLPPDLRIDLDDTLIRQFQLVPRETTAVQDAITELQDAVGELPDDPEAESVRGILSRAAELIEPARQQLDGAQLDLDRMDEVAPDRAQSLEDKDREEFQKDIKQQRVTLTELALQLQDIETSLEAIRQELNEENRKASKRKTVVWLGNILRLVQRSILVQARARLEAVTIEEIDLTPEDAFKIALGNRLDFMNGRAALVDNWRLLQVNADALQSVLDLTTSGELRTARNNALSFRAPTANVRFGLEFDAPFTRLLERNAYRESLVNYQRTRRGFIQSRDALHLGLRALLRQIELLRENLEIQRRAVRIAIRRVDLTRAQLYAPVPPPRPGQRVAPFGPTAAINLLSAQSALRDTQNNFLSVWLNYRATRIRLARELGIMLLDEDGKWTENPLPSSSRDGAGGENSLPEEEPLPPAVPELWMRTLELPAPQPGGAVPAGPMAPMVDPRTGLPISGPVALPPHPAAIGPSANRPSRPTR